MNRGHIPVRTCIACRTRRPATEMIRLKAQGDTVVEVPFRVTVSGRGCYVCPNEKCVKAALQKARLSKALRRNIVITPTKEALLIRQEQEEVTG